MALFLRSRRTLEIPLADTLLVVDQTNHPFGAFRLTDNRQFVDIIISFSNTLEHSLYLDLLLFPQGISYTGKCELCHNLILFTDYF